MKTTTKIKQTVTNYAVGDFLIRVKNVAMAKNKEVAVKSNKKLVAVSEALKKMGFIDSIKNEKGNLTVTLTFKNKKPRLMDLKLISKPGLRVYMGVDELEKKKSPSVLLVSTPKGMVSSLKAIKDRVGGEVIAEIW
jgi:small subunit ribosomal protein S8